MPGQGKPFAKGQGGRPKGIPNKTTRAAKENFALAFEALGGMERMVEWAQSDPDNLKTFYTLYARLIPTELAGALEMPTVVINAPHGGPKP